MNNRKPILLVSALLVMGAGAGVLSHLHGHQRLGRPALKTQPIPGSERLRVLLPERVLNYSSEELPVEKVVLDFLPKDTSFGQRRYTAPDGYWMLMNAILMGSDRTSLHKPQFCLAGIGWNIDDRESSEDRVRIAGPEPYDLPVMKLVARKTLELSNGHSIDARGIYVYWFVADGERTAQHWQRMWWMARDMVLTGVLQRWAYISCFSVCAPGQEEATYQRMKRFIAVSVPKFQQGAEEASALRASIK